MRYFEVNSSDETIRLPVGTLTDAELGIRQSLRTMTKKGRASDYGQFLRKHAVVYRSLATSLKNLIDLPESERQEPLQEVGELIEQLQQSMETAGTNLREAIQQQKRARFQIVQGGKQ
jgi:hypothetical protein